MLRKFLLIGVFILCAALYAYGPEWSSVSAQVPNQSIPDIAGIGTATPLGGTLSDFPQGNFTAGEPLVLNVDYTNDTGNVLEAPALSVGLPAGVTPTADSGWVEAGEGPDGTTIYTLSPEAAAGSLGNSIPPGAIVSAPLEVDIADTSGSEPISIGTRLDVYDGSQDPGSRLSAILGTMEILPAVDLPANIVSLSDTAIPTVTAEIQFLEPAEGSPAPTLNDATDEVSIPIEFTNTSGETLDNTLLVVEIPEGTELPENSGWREEIITDADGNEQRVAVLNVGSLAPNQSLSVPFPLIGNNVVGIGDTLNVPTLLSANDGEVQLRGEVAATLEQALVPLNLPEASEPENTSSSLYLPIIRH